MFTNLKQALTEDQHSSIVYRVQCKLECQTCGKFYIGESTWCLCDRFKTHASDVGHKEKNPRRTTLVKHVVDTGPNHHEFDFNRKEILKKVRRKDLLKIHEANQIILHANQTFNFKSDAAHIKSSVLQHHKKQFKNAEYELSTPTRMWNKWNEQNKCSDTSHWKCQHKQSESQQENQV